MVTLYKVKIELCDFSNVARSMTDYFRIFTTCWRGWVDCRYVSEDKRDVIMMSKARRYNDLLQEVILIKKKQLALEGGEPFYEPSTYYGYFRDAHYHANAEWAAARYASDIFSMFSRYTAHKCSDIRLVPEERDEYGLKLWRMSHPEALTAAQHDLWVVTNEVTVVEPWAWPMMIGLTDGYYMKENTLRLPVLLEIQEKFMGLGYTEDKFFETQKEIWRMLQWDEAKEM